MDYEAHYLREIHEALERILHELRAIRRELAHPTPTGITFQEISMNPEGPGVTQVWTGTLTPAGSAFPAGTTFTATPSDPTVSATLDPTGLVLTIAYPTTFVADPTNPFSVAWSTSTFTPEPSTSPASLTATITPTAPPPVTPTPTGVAFGQTS